MNASVHAASEAAERAQDAMAYEIGTTVLDMRRRGADDSEQLDGVMALVRLRMISGLDSAADEMAGGEPGDGQEPPLPAPRAAGVRARPDVGCLGCSVPLLAALAAVRGSRGPGAVVSAPPGAGPEGDARALTTAARTGVRPPAAGLDPIHLNEQGGQTVNSTQSQPPAERRPEAQERREHQPGVH